MIATGRPLTPVILAAGGVICATVALLDAALGTAEGNPLVDSALSAALVVVIYGSGALIVARVPGNRIGPLLCVGALLSVVGSAAVDYSVYGLLTAPGAVPAPELVGPFGAAARSIAWIMMIAGIPLLMPDGHLPSPRWRIAGWLAIATAVLFTFSMVFTQEPPDQRLTNFHNPFNLVSKDVSDVLSGLTFLLMFVVISLCIASVVVRFRHASGVERQQLKWFVYASAWASVLLFLIFLSILQPPWLAGFSVPGSVFYLAIAGIPVATAIAILQHRLYDIDVVINRTLVYGSLTAVLAALYLVLVVGAQRLTEVITGKDAGQQPLVIVITTLLVAALFQPLRRRIQATIDRRFYRARYDAARTLEAFGVTLRTEVELPALASQLIETIENTMRPAHVSLWLRSRHEPDRGDGA